MNENGGMEKKSEEFRALYDQFVNSCDAAEIAGKWDKEEYGEMEGYFFNTLMGILMNVINADGNIGAREAEVLNECFGFSYTVDELIELYGYCGKDLEANYAENAHIAMGLLGGIDEGLAERFRELVLTICGIVAESEDGVLESEENLLATLRDAVLK
ncbi:MAG: hypothetical protein K6A33_13270 [Clostridiales bacterium]|nr:hypothetical protein [Clostridiales bacterium]